MSLVNATGPVPSLHDVLDTANRVQDLVDAMDFDGLTAGLNVVMRCRTAHAALLEHCTADASALVQQTHALIATGKAIEKNPDDEAATERFVDMSEILPSMYTSFCRTMVDALKNAENKVVKSPLAVNPVVVAPVEVKKADPPAENPASNHAPASNPTPASTRAPAQRSAASHATSKSPAKPRQASMDGLSAAEKEEERLMRSLQRKTAPKARVPAKMADPVPVSAPVAASPAAAAAAPVPAKTDGLPLWKVQRMQREAEAKKRQEEDMARRKVTLDALVKDAGTKPAEPASTERPSWEPAPRREQSIEEMADAVGAPSLKGRGNVPVGPLATKDCAGCGIMIVGGYKNALGVAWHQECWKCSGCGEKLPAKFANMGGKPMCVACAQAKLRSQ